MKSKNIVLGLGDYGIITQPDQTLKTYALGSCIGLVLIDRTHKVVGMAHIVHPDSSLEAKQKPTTAKSYFADLAVPLMIEAMKKHGGVGKITVKLIGGSNMIKTDNHFQIGKRNLLAVKKHLWRFRLGTLAEDVEGALSRTVTVNLQGEVTIKLPGQPIRTI